MTGQTVVEQESPWTDHERARMLALAEYEAHCCKDCGTHESIAENPEDHPMVPDQRRCPICAGLDMHRRVMAAADDAEEKALESKNAGPEQPRDKDGRTLLLRPATPEEVEQRRLQLAKRASGQTSPSTPQRRRKGAVRG